MRKKVPEEQQPLLPLGCARGRRPEGQLTTTARTGQAEGGHSTEEPPAYARAEAAGCIHRHLCRSKKKFATQQMVMLLSALAHNVLVWARSWLSEEAPRLNRYGVLRFARDLMSVSGMVELDQRNRVRRIILNRAAALTQGLLNALRRLLLQEGSVAKIASQV